MASRLGVSAGTGAARAEGYHGGMSLHPDASHDSGPVPDPEQEHYRELRLRVRGLVEAEGDWLANLANVAAAVFEWLPDVNWVGFYLLKEGELRVGPFQGRPACVHIAVGSGVCGTAVAERCTQVVPDVHAFPGHIACDPASRSEIVVPILDEGDTVQGVLDIDSPVPGRFGDADRAGLEALVVAFAPHVDWARARRT